jgi:transglutaminase-like putative cysteine protease
MHSLRFIRLAFWFFLLMQGLLHAQSPYPFGTTPMSDMEMTEYNLDKDAPAVYLFDWCTAKLEVTNDLKVTVQRHFRIKILKQDGVDFANFKLSFRDKSNLLKIKASTFNLENGKIVESVLNKKDIYTERSGNLSRTGFAFNNVKVGSVIECVYTASYDSYFFLYPWVFQHEIPVQYSDYTVKFPALFRYKYQGYEGDLKFNFSQKENSLRIGSISTSEITYKWTVGNVPAFKAEPFMASEDDFLARVEFELEGIDWPNYGYEQATPTYEKLAEKLLNDENFGGPIKSSGFLKKIVAEITKGITNDLDKVKAIHLYITKNVKWNEENSIYTTYSSFNRILKEQSGSCADINLLFVAMLQAANITTYPVVLSTRENGALNPYFAIVTKFDYVVVYAKIGDKEYLMDATDELRPFDQLPFECLNGNGRTIHPRMSKWIPLTNGEQEQDQVLINAELGDDNSLVCKVHRVYGSYSAFRIRKLLNTTGKDGYLSLLKSAGNKEFSDLQINNLDSINNLLSMDYKVVIKGAVQSTSNLKIINPVLLFARTENPFSDSERKFPIDFGCPEVELYSLNLLLPMNYEVDEVPAELNLKLENDNASFQYLPQVMDKQIALMYRFNRKATRFPADNYLGVKDFYNKYIKKQSELIILKMKESSIVTR